MDRSRRYIFIAYLLPLMIESASRAKFGFNFVLFVLVSFGFYFFRVLTKHYRTYGNTTSRVQSSQNIAEMYEGA